MKLYEQKDYYQWAIVPKNNGDEPIGSISVVGMNDDVEMIHIGYCIGKNWCVVAANRIIGVDIG